MHSRKGLGGRAGHELLLSPGVAGGLIEAVRAGALDRGETIDLIVFKKSKDLYLG